MATAELESAALAASRELSNAEMHGTVCGMLVANIRASGLIEGGVHFSVEEYVDLVGAEAVADAETVEDFAALSLAGLDAEDLSFAPLLPDDDDPIADRVEALGEWCASFLAGLGAVAHTDLDETDLDRIVLAHQDEVSRGADRQELRQALHDRQQHRRGDVRMVGAQFASPQVESPAQNVLRRTIVADLLVHFTDDIE